MYCSNKQINENDDIVEYSLSKEMVYLTDLTKILDEIPTLSSRSLKSEKFLKFYELYYELLKNYKKGPFAIDLLKKKFNSALNVFQTNLNDKNDDSEKIKENLNKTKKVLDKIENILKK
jgi:hypothetical protein